MFLVKNAKSSNYQIIYEKDGKRTTKSTGKKTRKAAEAFLEKFKKTLIAKAVNNEPFVDLPTTNKISLHDFQTEYENYVKDIKSQKYLSSITSSFDHLIRFTGNIHISDLSIKLLDQFFPKTYSRTEKGAHHFYRTLRAAFNKAVSWEYLDVSPFSKVKLPQQIKQKPHHISIEELKLISSFAKEQYLKDLYLVAIYTGLRLGELVNLRWNGIDQKNNHIVVRCSDQFKTKNKDERIVPINKIILHILNPGKRKKMILFLRTSMG